jgi:hypothetical protein
MIDEDQRRRSVAGWAAHPRLEPHGAAVRIDHGNGEILTLECKSTLAASENEREYKGEKCARPRPLHPRPA